MAADDAVLLRPLLEDAGTCEQLWLLCVQLPPKILRVAKRFIFLCTLVKLSFWLDVINGALRQETAFW